MRLAVDLYGARIGTLEGDARTFDFEPTREGIRDFNASGRSSLANSALP
ncbi:MAG: hypothetical protein ACTHXA_04645 [Gulosibacter sp.]